jgi:hypothetical protein
LGGGRESLHSVEPVLGIYPTDIPHYFTIKSLSSMADI